MLREVGRRQMEAMLTTVALSPVFYGIIVLILPRVGGMHAADAIRMKNIFLVVCVGLIVGAHALMHWARGRGAVGGLTQAVLRLVCMAAGGMGEAVCVLGIIAVVMGLEKEAYIPFMAMGTLYFIDFRIFRVPRLMAFFKDPPQGK
jgi:hypothetical protein